MPGIEEKLRGSSHPDRLWTCGGISAEMMSGVVSPLCWSVWEQPVDLAYRRALADLGVLSRREIIFANDTDHQPAAPFFGRLAINVDATRELIGRIPGVSANDFERDMLGGVRDGQPDEPTAYARLPAMLVKTPLTMARATDRVARLHAANQLWWRHDVLGRSTNRRSPGASLHELAAARERFAESMYAHVRARFVAQSARRALMRVVERSADPGLAAPILAGYGGTADLVASDDLWRLARDQIDIDSFLMRHGFRGPNEGNVYTRSWREDHARVESLADAYRRRPDATRPIEAERVTVQARRAAERALLAGFPRSRRPAVRWLLARTEHLVRTLQLGRASYLMALDGCRAAARELGAALAVGGTLAEPDDAFFLTQEELADTLAGRLPAAGALVSDRRSTRAEYLELELPGTFTGVPETRPLGSGIASSHDDGVALSGSCGNPGVVEGRARVVLDPDEEADLAEGDILVCRATDPGWMALLALAAGVVIDNGGETSHGAIVSREFGIPCVIGTGNGTSIIANHDRIRVDGKLGTVRILERAATR